MKAYCGPRENIPLCRRIVATHAELIFAMKAVSNSGLSLITHVHTSTPTAIDMGEKISKGIRIK